ncbi:MAG TPA: xanthine dehydrogenase family protein subunit M [bacterium]|nr:xanthine dehydrogenase family protein subunit M [bacterium]HPQ67054.1 xanthine dehydrogenase family protein subunit M [bacterium]
MRFDYSRPRDLAKAVELLSRDPEARPLAGGTDILVGAQEGTARPSRLVDLAGIPELEGIREEDGKIFVGAAVTHAGICASPLLAAAAPLLIEGCAEVGSPQIRNRGTIGGNLVNASPAADGIPPLLALGAEVRIFGPAGARTLLLEEFLLGVKKTALEPGEVVVGVAFAPLGPDEAGFFLKLGQRRALAIAKVSAAGRVAFAGAAVKSARIVLGAVAVTAVRAASAEAFLEGKELTPETIAEAGRLAAGDSRAIADIRSTAAYRDEMAGLLVARGLERLAASRS